MFCCQNSVRLVTLGLLCLSSVTQNAAQSEARPTKHLFLVTEPLTKDNFVIELRNRKLIQMARKIIAGQVTDKI
jgi:hypothetical protein